MMKNLQAYEVALNGAVYFHQQDVGFLRLSGADRIDFLQRQSTNDLQQLASDRAVSTVLTSPTARILDVFTVIDEGESLTAISLPSRSSETFEFLRKRIFFSDQVTIEDLSAVYAQILLFGPKLGTILQNLGIALPEPEHLSKGEINGQTVTVLAQKILSGIGCRLLLSAASFDAVKTKLDVAGAISISSDVFEILRVEAGLPGPAGEFTDEYTPLEVQLGEMISDSKGCYTGQEIIARQITYDKVTKNLVGVKLGELMDAGVKIDFEGKSAGVLTSVVQSPRFGSIGLGVIRRQYGKVGTSLSIQKEHGSIVDAEVVGVPFR
jgi:folate-binding protein YgfZ